MNLKIYKNYNLSFLSTFKIGGIAKFYFKPKNINEIYEAIEFSKKNSLTPFIFGSGANILFPDKINEDYFFISLRDFIDFEISSDQVSVSAGFPISLTPFLGLFDLFFLYLLPGTTGAAVFMNVRYNEHEIGSFISKIVYLDLIDLKIKEIDAKNAKFSYKKSIFQDNDWVILQIFFKKENFQQIKNQKLIKLINRFKETKSDLAKFYKILNYKNIEKSFGEETKRIKDELKKIEDYRVSKNHFIYPSCGSVFKNNHEYGTPTGALVDRLGLKGFKYNDAQIAPYHGNIIINLGNAKAKDVLYLINLVQEKINSSFGFVPEPEIVIL